MGFLHAENLFFRTGSFGNISMAVIHIMRCNGLQEWADNIKADGEGLLEVILGSSYCM